VQTDNHASTSSVNFLQAQPDAQPTVKALKAVKKKISGKLANNQAEVVVVVVVHQIFLV